MIGFGDAVGRFYKNYFNFYGRASRAEYWWPVLMKVMVYIILTFVFFLVFQTSDTSTSPGDAPPGTLTIIILVVLFWLLNIIPGYAVAARRFHDLDQTGWLVLVFVLANAFIFVSVFAQIIWFCVKGTDGPNQYGPDPYGNDADIFG